MHYSDAEFIEFFFQYLFYIQPHRSQATSIYDSCVEERSEMIRQNKSHDLLPVCDLQKELENVTPRRLHRSSSFTIISVFPAERIRYRISIHHLHRSDQPVPGGAAMGRSVLSDAVHARYRFAVWHAGGRQYLADGYETVPQRAQGNDHRGNA